MAHDHHAEPHHDHDTHRHGNGSGSGDAHGDGHGAGHAGGHGGGHHHHGDLDWSAMGAYLEAQAELFAPLYRDALAWLAREVEEPGLIVDAGSGPGVVSCLLAEAFPDSRVVAVDSAAPLLERARARAAERGLDGRFDTLAGELPGVLAELDQPAGLLWAGRSLHHLGDQRAALTAFAERLAPGGTVALLEGGLPLRFLPRDIGFGRPGLQTRLDAVQEEWFAGMRASLPGTVAETEDWPALLTAAGLKDARTRSFLIDLPAPAGERARDYIAGDLSRLREAGEERLDAEDRATLDRLLDPSDPESVHRRPDVFVLGAYSVHTAVRPA
ncbi:class I SAM-dependent methyltransferase [Streptomyces sp. NPDC005573]|uniref:class I SAM-dependent methyltransferase n=1 Tax=Streptomyces sp. NPDC005573 TaxID=3156890 RepID=UPI0033AFA33B